MRIGRLFLQLTLFYLVVTGAVLGLATAFPGFEHFLPIGGAEGLLAGSADDPFETIQIGATRVGNLGESIIWLVIAVIGALLTIMPATWTYMACRDKENYDQSLVETVIILPILVTSIVILVHNSLALAFSLAGIVGAVRFRNSLKSSGDALFVLLAIGIGLSSGVGALEVALVMSVVFNYVFLALWALDYGWMEGARRYLRDRHAPPDKPHSEKAHGKKKDAEGKDADAKVAEAKIAEESDT
jgi:hypothetical protein